jgi:hypothetical protein
MSGTNCAFRISNPWMRIIMLFIKSTRNSGCVRKSTLFLNKIEKTLFTMLPLGRLITQQYHKKGFIVYATLI